MNDMGLVSSLVFDVLFAFPCSAENMQSSVEDLLQNFTNFIQEKRYFDTQA